MGGWHRSSHQSNEKPSLCRHDTKGSKVAHYQQGGDQEALSKYVSKCLKKREEDLHLSIKPTIATALGRSLAADLCTHVRTSYLAVTASVITHDAKHLTCTLGYVPFTGKHSGSSIAQAIQNVAETYAPMSDWAMLVTDGASNILKVAKLLNVLWSYCALHNFQRALISVTSRRDNKIAFAVCRRLVAHLSRSSTHNEKFREFQIVNTGAAINIPAPVATRYVIVLISLSL